MGSGRLHRDGPLFLYELALHIGVRSTDLVQRAHELGMSVEPGTYLTSEQVDRLAPGAFAPPPPPHPPGHPGAQPPAPAPSPPAATSGTAPAGASGRSPQSGRVGVLVAIIGLAALSIVLVGVTAGRDDPGEEATTTSTTVGFAVDRNQVERISPPTTITSIHEDVIDVDAFCDAWYGYRESLLPLERIGPTSSPDDVVTTWDDVLPAAVANLQDLVDASRDDLQDDAGRLLVVLERYRNWTAGIDDFESAMTPEQQDEYREIVAELRRLTRLETAAGRVCG